MAFTARLSHALKRNWPDVVILLSSLTGAFLLYMATLSRHFSADSLLIALRVEGDSLANLVDPTHILLEPLGYLWYQGWRVAGWEAGSIVPLQALNALGGAAAVGLMYVVSRTLTGSRRIAALVCAGFALSGGVWLLSVEAEFVTIPLTIQLLVLWLVLAPPVNLARGRGYGLALGVVVSLAILSYLSNALLLIVVGAGLLMQTGRSLSARLRQVAQVLLVVGLLCLPVAFGLLSMRSWPEWTARIWQDGGLGYTALTWFDGPHGLYAFLRTLGLFPGLALNESARALLTEASRGRQLAFAAYYGALLLAAVTPLLLAVRWRKQLWAGYRRELILLLLWAITFAAFAVYWVPGDISFWLPVLVAWWLLVALLSTVYAGQDASENSPVALPDPHQRALAGILLTFIVALGIANAALLILPRHDLQGNEAYRLAMRVSAQTSEADLIVSDADDLVTLYLVYFGRRTVLPVEEMAEADDLAIQFANFVEETKASGGQTYLLRDEKLVFIRP